MGKEAIKRVGGVVDIWLSNFPPNGGLVSEVVGLIWVIRRGENNVLGCGRLRCDRIRIGRPGGSVGW